MHDPVGERVQVALAPLLRNAEQRRALAGMLRYFGRSSLIVQRWSGSGPEDLVLWFASDTERLRCDFNALEELWQGLRAGRPVDWGCLVREK